MGTNFSHIPIAAGNSDPIRKRRTIDRVNEGCSGEADLLSRLPDDVLSRILSFLQLEAALRTKVLSRRWRHLCPCPTSLSFDFENYEDEGNSGFRKKYMSQIDKVMHQFSAAQVEKLELWLPENMGTEYAPKVIEWIGIANAMKVQHFGFGFCEYYEMGEKILKDGCLYNRLPLNLLRVSELSHLKYLEIVKCSLPPFSSLGGPIITLRTLILTAITFCQNNGSFDDIASYCPKLERLDLINCEQIPSMRYLCAELHYLKSLNLQSCNGVVDLEIHDGNITKFRVSNYPSTNNISFRSLKYLRFVDIWTRCSGKSIASFLSSLPEETPQLKSLRLIMPWSREFQSPTFLSTFRCLKHLEMHIFTTIATDVRSLFGFVGAAPFLQNFILDLSGECTTWQKEQLHRAYKEAPIHVHFHLKSVEIRRGTYRLGEGDVELAVALLKSAISLEKMILGSLFPENCIELQRVLATYKPRVQFRAALCRKY